MVSKKNSTLNNKAKTGMLSGQDSIDFNENYKSKKKNARRIHSFLNEKTKDIYETYHRVMESA